MKPMTQREGVELVWSQPKLTSREFDLRDGNDLVATLKWHRPLGSLATGETASGAWTFKRAGFLRPRVEIWTVSPKAEFAQFEAGWAGGGRLLLPHDRGYYWRQRRFWQNEWAFEDEHGAVALTFNSDSFVLKRTVYVRLLGSGYGADRPLLAVLGLYLMVLSGDEATAALLACG